MNLISAGSSQSSVKLFYMAVGGDTLVGAANESGHIKLYAVDLNTGQMRQIGTSDPGVGMIHTSGRYVVWNRGSIEEVFAYDLQTNKETRIAPGIYPDVSGSIVVWVDWRHVDQGDSADIYGYDLALGKEFPVVTRPGAQTQPKIAGQWVAYLEILGERDYRLRAHHIQTGEDFEVGAVPVFIPPSELVVAKYFALSGNRLAWIPAQDVQTVHLYDLNTRTDRLVFESDGVDRLALDGDILLHGGRGYDLSRNTSFSIPGRPSDEWLGASGSPLLLSGDRLVWALEKDEEGIQHIFTARIVRGQ